MTVVSVVTIVGVTFPWARLCVCVEFVWWMAATASPGPSQSDWTLVLGEAAPVVRSVISMQAVKQSSPHTAGELC